MSRMRTLPPGARLAPGSMPLREEPAFPPRAVVEAAGTSPTRRLQALGRLPAGEMNQTERRYAEHLDALKAAGEVVWWAFEVVKLRLAKDCHLTVDFMVMRADGRLEAVDVKGAAHLAAEDSKAKLKVAARTVPWPFFIAIPRKKKDGGGWDVEEVGA